MCFVLCILFGLLLLDYYLYDRHDTILVYLFILLMLARESLILIPDPDDPLRTYGCLHALSLPAHHFQQTCYMTHISLTCSLSAYVLG